MRPLSHSSISLYLECPQKYKLKYLDKIPEKPKSFFSFGKSVHSALEFFYNVPALPAPTLEQVLERYRSGWLSEGYKDAAHEAEYLAEGERILREFYAKHIAEFQPPFFAEYRFDLLVDGVPVMGYVDRIDKLGDGRLAIVDYKTGKAFSEQRVREDAQLTMYQMACEELLGAKVARLTFYHLNSLTPHSAEPHSPEQVDRLRERIALVSSSIRKGLFEPRPEERKCSWCDFKPFCPVFQDGWMRPDSPAAAEPGPATDAELGALADRYGELLAKSSGLQEEVREIEAALIARLKELGWARAFGGSHEVTLSSEERWEFRDKAKVLELIRGAGLWEDILAPSAPLVQKLMQDPSAPPELRRKLERLGEKVRRDAIKSRPLGEDALIPASGARRSP